MPLGDVDAERFDPMMLQMAQQVAAMADGENPIELLLDLYFGFLRRKTDFFDAPERCKDAVLAAYQRQADVVAASSASKKKSRVPCGLSSPLKNASVKTDGTIRSHESRLSGAQATVWPRCRSSALRSS